MHAEITHSENVCAENASAGIEYNPSYLEYICWKDARFFLDFLSYLNFKFEVSYQI